MRDPESIHGKRRRTADSGVVDCDRDLWPLWLSSTTSGWCCPRSGIIRPAAWLRIYFNVSWGLLAALYFLMVGYVSKDAPRRAMSSRFWMLICFVMPGGIGAVLYFLLRRRWFRAARPAARYVQSDFHFCPQCNYQLTASCGNCFRTVRATRPVLHPLRP